MKYRNTKTGVVIDVNSKIGGDWEEISDSRISSVSEVTEEKPEKKKATKPKTKKK